MNHYIDNLKKDIERVKDLIEHAEENQEFSKVERLVEELRQLEDILTEKQFNKNK